MDFSLSPKVSLRVILSEYRKLGNQFVSVHGVCTWGWRLNLRVLRSVVNVTKLPRRTGYPYGGLYTLLFYVRTQQWPHDIDYIGDKVYDIPLISGVPWKEAVTVVQQFL